MRKFIFCLFLLNVIFSCTTKPRNTQSSIKAVGIIERIEDFESQYVTNRNVDIWLPENYIPEEKYAVLYMHDGQMLYDSNSTWNKQEWGVDETMNALIDKEEIRKTIVVGIWNTKDRHAEYFPQKPFENLPLAFQDSLIHESKRDAEKALFSTSIQSDDYLKFLVLELKPFIDKKYSTLSDRANTFVMGSSMGGLISIYALCEYPEIFGGAACLSTHWTGTFSTENNPIPTAFKEYLKEHLPDPNFHNIYFDYGTETLDALYEPYQLQVDSVMISHAYSNENWVTLKFDGADHSERSWQKRLNIPLNFLLYKDIIRRYGLHYQLHKDFASLQKAVELMELGSDTSYVRSILGEPIDMGFDYRYLLDSVGGNGCVVGAVFHLNDNGEVDQKWIDEICE